MIASTPRFRQLLARQFDGSTAYMRHDATIVAAYPLTMCCWFRADNDTSNGVIMFTGNSAADNAYLTLEVRGGDAGDPLRAVARNTTYTPVDTSKGFLPGIWHHAAAVFRSGTDRSVYLDGGSRGDDTTSVTVPTLNRFSIGRLDRATPGDHFLGQIALPQIYNFALTETEIVRMAAGAMPWDLFPWTLSGGQKFWEFAGTTSSEYSILAGIPLELANTATFPVLSDVRQSLPNVWEFPHHVDATGNRRRRMLIAGTSR